MTQVLTYKKAVCLAALNAMAPANAPQLLAISRRNDNTRWGLPGGKVDAGESNLQALVRECHEELGVTLSPSSLHAVYVGICPGKGVADTYEVTTFVTTEHLNISELTAEDGMEIRWQSPGQLCSDFSPFKGYNKEAIQRIQEFFENTVVTPPLLLNANASAVTLSEGQLAQLSALQRQGSGGAFTLASGDGPLGHGVYAYREERPEEGSVFLDPWRGPALVTGEPPLATEASLRLKLSFAQERIQELMADVHELRGRLTASRNGHTDALLRIREFTSSYLLGTVKDANQAGRLLLDIETAVTTELLRGGPRD